MLVDAQIAALSRLKKLIAASAFVLVAILGINIFNGKQSDPIASMIAHTENAIVAFKVKNYELFYEEEAKARSASIEHWVNNRRLPERSVESSEAGYCDDSALNNQYNLVSEILSSLATEFSNGKVSDHFLEFDAPRFIEILKESRLDKGVFSLSDVDERRIEEGCENLYPGYAAKRRSFDVYVFVNIEGWVKELDRIGGIDIMQAAESTLSTRSLERKLDDPNAWHQLSEGEKAYHFGTNPKVRDCIDAFVSGGASTGVSTAEIASLCRVGLK